MSRAVLANDCIGETADRAISSFQEDVVKHVQRQVKENEIVVIGMVGNPFVKKAKKSLDSAGITFTYLEYGGYLSQWRKRLAIKLWSGWPTFPQVFSKGVLIGGADELAKLIDEGRIKN